MVVRSVVIWWHYVNRVLDTKSMGQFVSVSFYRYEMMMGDGDGDGDDDDSDDDGPAVDHYTMWRKLTKSSQY